MHRRPAQATYFLTISLMNPSTARCSCSFKRHSITSRASRPPADLTLSSLFVIDDSFILTGSGERNNPSIQQTTSLITLFDLFNHCQLFSHLRPLFSTLTVVQPVLLCSKPSQDLHCSFFDPSILTHGILRDLTVINHHHMPHTVPLS